MFAIHSYPTKSLAEVPQDYDVFVKVLLPTTAIEKDRGTKVEGWIAALLRKAELKPSRAMTGWVKLPKGNEEPVDVWSSTNTGHCPVSGNVPTPTTDGKLKITLPGWAPFPCEIQGAMVPAEIGTRRIAVVEEDLGYIAILVSPRPSEK